MPEDNQNNFNWGLAGSMAGIAGELLPNMQDTDELEAVYGNGADDNWARFYDVVSGNSTQRYLEKLASDTNSFNNINSINVIKNAYNANKLKSSSNIDSPFSFSGWVDNAKAGLQGMKKGSIGGGWGMLGGLSSEGTLNWLTRMIGYSNKDEIDKANERYDIDYINNYYNQVNNINKENQRQAMMNYFADGGSLEELNGVTKFNVGGSHSDNPYEGIQQGIASDGNPNLVEEGEVKYNDYIYSARLKPSETMLKEFNLPEKYAGKTFAELADILQKESKDRPNDPISKQTLDDWMSRLASAQEEYKAKQAERKLARVVDNMSDEQKAAIMSSLAQPTMQEQEGIDLSQSMYAKGGKIYIKPENRGKFTALKKRTGKSASWFKAHGTPAQKKMATFALNAKKWKHEDGGHLFDNGGYPWQVGYLYDNGILNKEYPLMSTAFSPYISRVLRDPLLERYLTKELSEVNINDKKSSEPVTYISNRVADDIVPKFANLTYELNDLDAAIEDVAKKEPNNTFSFSSENLRYAPVLGSAEAMLRAAFQPKDYTLANQLREIGSQYNPIGGQHISGYRKYTPYDVNLGDVENLALEAAALRANRGQNRATQTAVNIATINAFQKAKAQRNLAVQQANEANRLAVDQYNLGIDQFNAQRDTQYDQLNQQILNNRLNMMVRAAAAEDASKEAWANMYNSTRENFFNQLGNVGRDEWNRKAALAWMAEHPELANTDYYKLIKEYVE